MERCVPLVAWAALAALLAVVAATIGASEPARADLAAFENGKIAFRTIDRMGVGIGAVNPDGSAREVLVADYGVHDVSWSPDGTRFVFAAYNALYVADADGTDRTFLISEGCDVHEPAWSPDGDKIAFRTDDKIKTINPDGSGVQTLTDPDGAFEVADPAFSPDGTRVAFQARRPSCPNCSPSSYPQPDIYAVGFNGTEQAISRWANLTNTEEVGEYAPAWQPNSAPQVELLRPSPGATTADRTPRVEAGVTDAQSELSKGDITLRLDGRTVPRKAFDYDRGADRLSYVPGDRLAHGRHTARVEA